MKRFTPWIIASVLFVVGFLVGGLFPLFPNVPFFEGARELQHSYTFINPLLECREGSFNHLGNDETKALETKLSNFIATKKAQGLLRDGGIYFRELNGGPWVGVNSDAEFTPGSLLKVPLAMSVLEKAEKVPGLLDSQIQFEGGDAPGIEHFTSDTIQKGNVYTVTDLVRATLVHSDNNAAVLLAQLVGKQSLDDSYTHLGIDTPVSGQDYSTTVRTYASFFRILYNGTYLTHDHSELLLSMLADSVFTQGIVSGVPSGTVVAHKFGERSLTGQEGVQLHDCGIVYHPNEPYLLCVMLRGKDFDVLANAIGEISRIVYESVN